MVAEGASGVDALRLSESQKPDVVFMDIQMPDLTGLQAAAALLHMEPSPFVVFVTGYTEHAVSAFEYAAFDYLLKPVEPERLAITVARAGKRLNRAVAVKEEVNPQDLSPVSRLPVRTDYAIKLIRVEEIDFALARDKKVFLRSGDTEQKTYYTLQQLERLLPLNEFQRIHASVIVRLPKIEELNFLGNHSYSVTLTGGKVLPVGRTYYADLQKRLGIQV